MIRAAKVLFAAAMLAQLAGPVLAANAPGLNLLCPSHADGQQAEPVNDTHHQHAHHQDAHASHAADVAPAPSVDHNDGKPRFFDLACCSAHLTGVMPIEGVLSSRMIAPIEVVVPEGGPVFLHAALDPPPRIFV